eukprot:m.116689 g.116689  ORF g.116689 m.116689 type:complete len:113 (-) comp15522_c0_seq2:244-582(-)
MNFEFVKRLQFKGLLDRVVPFLPMGLPEVKLFLQRLLEKFRCELANQKQVSLTWEPTVVDKLAARCMPSNKPFTMVSSSSHRVDCRIYCSTGWVPLNKTSFRFLFATLLKLS